MSAVDTHKAEKHPADTVISGTPTWVVPALTLLVLFAVIVGALFLVNRGDLIGTVAPLAAPAIIAAIIPKKHGWRVRLPLAIIAGLAVLFVMHMMPAGANDVATDAGDAVAATPQEPKTLLSWLLGLPLVGAIGILFMPRQAKKTLEVTTLLIMIATLAVSIPLLAINWGRGYHLNQDIPWIESESLHFSIHYHVAIDGISFWLVMLTTFITPLAAYASFGSIKMRMKDWCFALLLLEGAMIGSFISMDLFLFYVFWELMLIPMYVMIGVWGGTNRIKSAIKFFIYTMAGSLMMLVAILYLGYTYGKAIPGGMVSFDYFELQRLILPRHVQMWLYAAFALSFLIKVPMWPLHTWLPDAHTEAPTGGSVILAAVMLKMGTYGYLRFCMGLFPEAAGEFGATLAGIAVLGGILYGALCAWKQDDVKRLVAYSSVAHLGYVMLGLFAATQASVEGAVLQMVNHGVSTGALFLLVGVIYDRRHTRQLGDFGGLAKPMPVYATLFIIATLASIGLPGTNGFVGEFMIITGTFVSSKLGHVSGIQAVGAAIGVILGALYMLTAVQKMFFGPITKPENKHVPDINGREILALSPLMIMIFVIGFFPNIFLSTMRDATARTLSEYSARLDPAPPLNQRYLSGPIVLTARSTEAPPAYVKPRPKDPDAKTDGPNANGATGGTEKKP